MLTGNKVPTEQENKNDQFAANVQLPIGVHNQTGANAQDPWTPENTYIYVILGDKVVPDNNKNQGLIKYANYSPLSNAILIRRLAMKNLGINKDHIVVFAKGTQENFKPPTKKIFSQITIDEIYYTNINEEDLQFIYYTDICQVRYSIVKQLISVPNAHILLYIDDHGYPGIFIQEPFFNYYLIFNNIPHHSLFILNDSCYSGSVINLCDNYFKISEALISSKITISNNKVNGIKEFAARFAPDKKFNCFDYIYDIITNLKKSEYPHELIIYTILSAYSSIQNLFKENLNDKLNIDLKDINDSGFLKYVQFLTENGITTISQLSVMYDIINYYNTTNPYASSNFDAFCDIIINSFEAFRIIHRALDNPDNQRCKKIIDDLFEQKISFKNLINKHQNHCIITSSHQDGLSATFGSRRIKNEKGDDIKIIAGSPAMGAYIISTLMDPTENGIDIERIKKIASENDEGYKEYAVKSKDVLVNNQRKIAKSWIRLYFDEWKSSNLEKNFYKPIHLSRQEKMSKINFELAVRFDSTMENPIENYMTGQYIINFNKSKISKRKRYRISKNPPENISYSNPDVEKDQYYSDKDSSYESIFSICNILYSSNDSISDLPKENWNDPISEQKLNRYKKNYKPSDDYFFDLVHIFYEILSQKTKKLNNQFKYNPELDIKCASCDDILFHNLQVWVNFFVPPWEIYFYSFFSQIYVFMTTSKMPIEKFQIIFFKCFNIADQIVTPYFYINQKTYRPKRLTEKPDLPWIRGLYRIPNS